MDPGIAAKVPERGQDGAGQEGIAGNDGLGHPYPEYISDSRSPPEDEEKVWRRARDHQQRYSTDSEHEPHKGQAVLRD